MKYEILQGPKKKFPINKNSKTDREKSYLINKIVFERFFLISLLHQNYFHGTEQLKEQKKGLLKALLICLYT